MFAEKGSPNVVTIQVNLGDANEGTLSLSTQAGIGWQQAGRSALNALFLNLG